MGRAAITAILLSVLFAAEATAKEPVDRVDPFIGTTGFAVTNPGAVCPGGMMSVVPFNVMGTRGADKADDDANLFDKDERWWSAPYEYRNKFFTGFSHVNLSGVGCPELGSLLVMPTTGDLDVEYRNYGSPYTDEAASPGYYTNRLTKYDILTEVTATMRAAIHRYTFPAGRGNILLNLGQGLTNESGAWARFTPDGSVEGMKMMGTFCYNPRAVFPLYFVMEVVGVEPERTGFWKMQPPKTGVEAEWDPNDGQYKIYDGYRRDIAGDDIGAWWSFSGGHDGSGGDGATYTLEVKIGVSAVSVENARENLHAEIAGRSFDEVRAEAREKWNSDLSRIRVEGGTDEQKTVFYTALYHTLLHPNVISDVNGEYPAMEAGEVLKADGYTRYTVFSLWDTYRNVHQLLTLVFPDRQRDMVRSMIDMYREWGWMPKWELYGRETWTMEGDPAIPVIADTWLKGLRDFDIETAYEAFIKSATMPGLPSEGEGVEKGGALPDSYYALLGGEFNRMRPDNSDYMRLGYVPLRREFDNSVSHALEYYIADHALGLLAEDLGKKEDAAYFKKRALGYRRYYSAESGTLRPILPDGSFLTPFDPALGADFEPNPGFHEGSAWNYTFYVPHDVAGLAHLMGGKRKFVEKLESVFEKGLYDPANEPDIAYPHLFSYFEGEEWRTQKHTRELLEKHFTASPDGIPGNDDTGAMSAWAVFNMLGLYPDCPGSPYYTVTSPVFDRVTIALDTESWPATEIVIEARRTSPEQIYIKDMTLGGAALKQYRISHADLLRGGRLVMNMTSK